MHNMHCNAICSADLAGEHDRKQENGGNRSEAELLNDLRRTLHRNNVILKTNTPASSWRAGLVERIVGLTKKGLDRSGLSHKSHTLQQWQFILLKIQKEINDRALNINFINDNFEICSANCLMYGREKMSLNQNVNLENLPRGPDKLFGRLGKLEMDLKKFQDIFWNSYGLEVTKWLKWKNSGKTLEVNDVVYILDKKNKETRQNQLGIIKEVHSGRTYNVEYVQKSMKVDPETFEVEKVAKKSNFDRPAQKLCLITSKDECRDYSVEPRPIPGLLQNIEEDETNIGGEEYVNNVPDVSVEEDQLIVPSYINENFVEENQDNSVKNNTIDDNIENSNVETGENTMESDHNDQETENTGESNEEVIENENKNGDANDIIVGGEDKTVEDIVTSGEDNNEKEGDDDKHEIVNGGRRVQPSRAVKKAVVVTQDNVEEVKDVHKPSRKKKKRRKKY